MKTFTSLYILTIKIRCSVQKMKCYLTGSNQTLPSVHQRMKMKTYKMILEPNPTKCSTFTYLYSEIVEKKSIPECATTYIFHSHLQVISRCLMTHF